VFSPVGLPREISVAGDCLFFRVVYPPVSVGYILRELITGYVSQTSISKKEHWEKNSESRAEHGS
jgi:hypothetical protein